MQTLFKAGNVKRDVGSTLKPHFFWPLGRKNCTAPIEFLHQSNNYEGSFSAQTVNIVKLL